MLNLRPHDLREQALDLALRERKLARQRAHPRQGAWAELGTGHNRVCERSWTWKNASRAQARRSTAASMKCAN
jgi:hypothetical protein